LGARGTLVLGWLSSLRLTRVVWWIEGGSWYFLVASGGARMRGESENKGLLLSLLGASDYELGWEGFLGCWG
jgi:hypothetical protein